MINYISLMTNMKEPFPLCIIHLYFFFGEILIKSMPKLLSGTFVLFSIELQSYLYILNP